MNTLYLCKARRLLVKIGNDITVLSLDSLKDTIASVPSSAGFDPVDTRILLTFQATAMLLFACYLGWKAAAVATYGTGARLAELNYQSWVALKRSIGAVRIGAYHAKQYVITA